MRPITFVCQATLSLTPDEILQQIMDVTKWPDFHGHGPIPGIKTAEFKIRTPNIVGSRIRVTNRDRSQHTEEIVEWQPDQRLRIRFGQFSAPLSRLASEFFETWAFRRDGNQTRVMRTFELRAKSMAAWPVLWLISFLLKRAIARHLQEMNAEG